MEFQAILDAVRALPKKDQVRLVNVIQDELQNHALDPDLTPAMAREVKRRLAEYDADPSIGVPWEEVEARIDKRLEELGE